jgi:hypothetical protein
MTAGSDVAALYREFTAALTEVPAENAAGPARRGRLARDGVHDIPPRCAGAHACFSRHFGPRPRM